MTPACTFTRPCSLMEGDPRRPSSDRSVLLGEVRDFHRPPPVPRTSTRVRLLRFESGLSYTEDAIQVSSTAEPCDLSTACNERPIMDSSTATTTRCLRTACGASKRPRRASASSTRWRRSPSQSLPEHVVGAPLGGEAHPDLVVGHGDAVALDVVVGEHDALRDRGAPRSHPELRELIEHLLGAHEPVAGGPALTFVVSMLVGMALHTFSSRARVRSDDA